MEIISIRNVVIITVLSVIVAVGFYIYTFGFSLSNDHSTWAEFGAFFSGVLGPILTIGSILFLYASTTSQIEGIKIQNEISSQEKQVERISNFLHNEMTNEHFFIVSPQRAFKDFNWELNDIEMFELGENTHRYYNKKEDHSFIYGNSNIFGFINSYIRLSNSAQLTRSALIDDNDFLIKAKIETFNIQFQFLLSLCYDLLGKGYDLTSIRFILAEPFEQVKLLNKIGVTSDETLIRTAYFLSLPIFTRAPNIDQKALIEKSFLKSFSDRTSIKHLEHQLSQDKDFHHFRIQDNKTKKTYIMSREFKWEEE